MGGPTMALVLSVPPAAMTDATSHDQNFKNLILDYPEINCGGKAAIIQGCSSGQLF